MQVTRNFDAVYAAEADPRAIGNADSARYDFYYASVLPHISASSAILDIGCGQAAFLSRFNSTGANLYGLEYAAAAIERGKERFPYIHLYQGSADALERCLPLQDMQFDAIILSDVIYYLKEKQKRACLQWVAEHLSPKGIVFIAAYAPGGHYLRPMELENLISRFFGIVSKGLLESEHAWFVCRKAQAFAALTYDYETWHPIPEGKKIDWQADMLAPTETLLATARQHNVPLTFFVEMAEILWLQQNEPEIASRIEEQIRNMAKEGHDIQLHLHPNWLPELGVRHEGEEWFWDWRYKRMADYPGDLTELIARLKAALEAIVAPVDPAYRVACFRSGAYACQPFKPLHDALAANGIFCDSSVYPEAVSIERGYDFQHAYSKRQPYFASSFTPQLKAPPAENALLELPITVIDGARLQLDGDAASDAAQRIQNVLFSLAEGRPSSESLRIRWRLKNILMDRLSRLRNHLVSIARPEVVRKWRRACALLYRYWPLPGKAYTRWLHFLDTRYPPDPQLPDSYFVCIGHSKCCCTPKQLSDFIVHTRAKGVTFASLSSMSTQARADFDSMAQRMNEQEAADFQVQREFTTVMTAHSGSPQSEYLQAMLPLDRTRVLDLGCGSGRWSHALHVRYPWLSVHGVDAGEAFVVAARERYANDSVTFSTGIFTALPFADASFDAIYADNTLEHAHDVQGTLAEAYRVLADGGCLLAAIPPDGYNPDRPCDNHTWKTIPADVHSRLISAGFSEIFIKEVDVRQELGQALFPPSLDKMLYVLAWKHRSAITGLARATALQNLFYHRIEPDTYSGIQTPEAILQARRGLCADYSCVLCHALLREGYQAHIRHIFFRGHPHGRGPEKTDTHTIVEAVVDGSLYTFDPTLNIVYPVSIEALRQRPALADDIVQAVDRDARWERGYSLYCSTDAWNSVVKVTS